VYLQRYSPDLNPTEKKLGNVKYAIRSPATGTFGRLGAVMDWALSSITPQECTRFFSDCVGENRKYSNRGAAAAQVAAVCQPWIAQVT